MIKDYRQVVIPDFLKKLQTLYLMNKTEDGFFVGDGVNRLSYQYNHNVISTHQEGTPRGEGVTISLGVFPRSGCAKMAKDFTKRFYNIVSSSIAVILASKIRGRPTTFNGVLVYRQKSMVGVPGGGGVIAT